ncbi:hypothetical protein LY76DRAFT_209306 [Colletotrichum caudatum]|nr:hypothetical protein LY76DRAFT_209306 [Colletotrichum caudatum]
MSATNDSGVFIPSPVQAATFCPNPFSSPLNESLQNIPKCLMRVSDPKSPGRTTEREVCSPASLDPRAIRADLYQIDAKKAAEALRAYLWWECGIECNLVSWTSSMLCALQYALYRRHHYGHKLSDIKILLVDTKELSDHVFARDLQAIAAFKNPSTRSSSLNKLYEFRSSGKYFCRDAFMASGGFIRHRNNYCSGASV